MTDELYEATKKEVMSEHEEYVNADVPKEIWIQRNEYLHKHIDRLEKVDKAEKILKDHVYRNVRVRYHGKVARIEIGKDERTNLKKLKKIVKDIKKLGFKYVTLDLEGFRSGSLNE